MMKSTTRNMLFRVLMTLVFALLSVLSLSAQATSAVRFVHVIPNTAPIDVYINGTLAVTDLAIGESSGYITVPAGDHTVTATPTGIATPLWEQAISATEDRATTFIASSAEAGRFDQFDDNIAATGFGVSRLLLVHALSGGPAVDVQLAEAVELGGSLQDAGTTIASSVAYGTSFGAFDLPAQTYSFDILPTGGTDVDVLVPALTLPLSAGTSYIAVVNGTADAPQALLLATPTNPATESGFVRFAHAVIGAPNVDVYVNDTLIAPQLSPTMPTEHIALPAGDHTVALRVAGTEDELFSGDLTVAAGTAQTIVALPAEAGVSVNIFVDDISGVSEGQGAASVINGVSGSTATVSLSDGTNLATDLAFGESASATAIAPTSAAITVDLALSDATGTINVDASAFYGGNYYNIILLEGTAFSGPTVVVAPTTLAQSLASAPGADTSTLELASSDTTTANASEVVVAEEPAQTAATPVPQVATTAGDEDTVTGRILLDPSANLQLRQRPSVDALSLGLAPSGTVLTVNGREGRPVALVDGQDPPPEAETYVDPAENLAEDEDLDPQATWLNVTYETPDGGQIVAWVLAQFLEVRDAEGDLQRLADLETIGNNIAGEAISTELTPPPIPEDRVVAEVYNLNPGVSLNIRRTPTTQGEVLQRLPLDTRVELLGLLSENEELTPLDSENAEWAFISYQPAEGGVVNGWVSTLYVRYEYNGRSVDAAELQERALIEAISPERIGEISGGAAQAALPTPDPLADVYVAEVVLDAGANLQFRLDPNRDSESLNLIPSGTQLIVESRTASGDWLKATFEGEAGWISSQFVTLSFNGESVDIFEIPVDTTVPDDTDTDDTDTTEAVG